MKYDDASWHYGGDFPADLPPESGATHIAIFFAWAITRNLEGKFHTEEETDRARLDQVRNRQIDPREFFIAACDEKLTDEDLSDEGNAFASEYYESESGYFVDLDATFADSGDTFYHLANTWENYERMFGVLDQRFAEWKRKKE